MDQDEIEEQYYRAVKIGTRILCLLAVASVVALLLFSCAGFPGVELSDDRVVAATDSNGIDVQFDSAGMPRKIYIEGAIGESWNGPGQWVVVVESAPGAPPYILIERVGGE